jgi:dTDP-4-amino-4,6-dideoxygalactose transaminase
VLLLSHMRGHICDMDRLMQVCDGLGIRVIEDCAHTMGAEWNGMPSGRHGLAACYSTQTYKHINSGEGGLITSDDPDLMARAIVLSGSYMLFGRHTARPPVDRFENVKLETPNVSGRMDHLRAAILRVQLADLSAQVDRWNALYRAVETGLRNVPGLRIVERDPRERIVGSSIQFLLPGWDEARIRTTPATLRGTWGGAEMVRRGRARGLHLALRQLALCPGPEIAAENRRHSRRSDRHAPAADLLDGGCDTDRRDHP